MKKESTEILNTNYQCKRQHMQLSLKQRKSWLF